MFLIPVDILLAMMNPIGVILILLTVPILIIFIIIILRRMFQSKN